VQRLASLAVAAAVEVGPGRVLNGLIKRICPTLPLFSFADPSGLDALRPLVSPA
jgi:malonyl CoA-acyl carrier protein transacylase